MTSEFPELSPQNVDTQDDDQNDSSHDESNCSIKKSQDEAGDGNGQDESDDDARKLFVGGLSWETSEGDLKTYFTQWGNVTRCIIKVDRYTGNSRGFGFVTFDSEEAVNKVLSVVEHKLIGKRIDPKRAKPSREVMKKIFVGGIDPELTKDNIMEYFGQFGQVESLDLPYDAQRGKRKHYVFVSFSTEAAAKKAIAKERQEIYGRQCDVRVAVTREQANKNKGMKWYGMVDPNYVYPSYPYGDYNNAYQGLDPYAYSGYYGYDYVGAAAPTAASGGYGAYANYGSSLFRNQPMGGGNNGNSNSRSNHQQQPGGGGYGSNRMGTNPSAVATGILDQNAFSNSLAAINVSDYSGGAVQQQQHQ